MKNVNRICDKYGDSSSQCLNAKAIDREHFNKGQYRYDQRVRSAWKLSHKKRNYDKKYKGE